jgi:streptomycin 6-kinase
MPGSDVPDLDEELRRRLGRRFGAAVEPWLDALPPVLSDLAERWHLALDSLIQRGSISVVIRCRTTAGRGAVLKISPNRTRILDEAAALRRWTTNHVPAVLALDEDAGALLIEAVQPGTALDQLPGYPRLEGVASLIRSLHAAGAPDPSYRPVADHIAYLYESGKKNYERRPDLMRVVPPQLYERGRRLAMRLAEDATASVLLHGDLTPVNILDGGNERGLVAIDPAPCLGEPAFDAIDVVLWRTEDVATIASRAEQLGPAIGADGGRLLAWCAAFAAMTALELAEGGSPAERVEHFIELATDET